MAALGKKKKKKKNHRLDGKDNRQLFYHSSRGQVFKMLLGNAPLGDAKEPSTFCPFLLLSDVALASASSFDLQSIRGTFLPVFMTMSVTAFMACSYNTIYFSHLKILNPVTLQRPFVQVAHCKVSGCSI